MALSIRPVTLASLVSLASLAGTACSSPRESASPSPDPAKTAVASTPPSAPPDVHPVVEAGAPPPSTSGVTPKESSDGEVDPAHVRAANDFTLKALLGTNGANGKKKGTTNALVSGTSLRQALAAVYLGARGETAREMAKALALPEAPEKAAEEMRAEIAALEKARGKDAELVVDNRVWADRSLTIEPSYAALAEKILAAPGSASPTKGPAIVEFAKTEEARTAINKAVAETTKNKIAELLPRGALDAQTRLVVTNAVYMKARWSLPFPKAKTKDLPFKGTKTASVPTMANVDSYRIAQADGVKALELRYDGGDLSMLLVLPDDPNGLAKVEGGLTADKLETWTKALSTARVDVTLPRFTFGDGGAVGATLKELGIKTAFGDKADFNGIATKKSTDPIRIADVFHKTWIAVDEIGTEAAAATGVVMRTTSMIVGEPVVFHADHPFLFFIRSKDRIVFAGRLTDPKSP